MSFFNKAIASAGFGSAKVNTCLDTQKICKGEQVTGFINISGGKSEQKVSEVCLVLMTYANLKKDGYEDRKPIELSRFDVAQNIQIKPNEEIKIPFAFVLPSDTPISFNSNMIWLETSLDIKMAIDPSNRNYIQVAPHPFMQRILDIIQKDLKFALTNYENIYVPNNGSHLPIVQVFEFNPTLHLTEHLTEIKMIFFMDDLRGLEILMEIPKKARDSQENIHKASSINDSMVRILIPKKDFEKDNSSLADLLLHGIQKHLE